MNHQETKTEIEACPLDAVVSLPTKHRKILNLISEIRYSHEDMIEIYTRGSCLNFHIILRTIFPRAVPWFNIDHIITEIDGKFYDITGSVSNKGYRPFTEYYNKCGLSRSFKQMYRPN